jgi:hypothetical protein
MFLIESKEGDWLAQRSNLDDAVREAKRLLADNPERGELIVAEWRHIKTVTFGPSADWDTEIVVLEPGERISAPGYVPHRISEEDLEGYELDDPKRWALAERIGEWA